MVEGNQIYKLRTYLSSPNKYLCGDSPDTPQHWEGMSKKQRPTGQPPPIEEKQQQGKLGPPVDRLE